MFTSLLIAMPILFKKIREKEDFQYCKHYKKFNDDYQPDLPSPA
jgi:hypothetical protein